MKWTGPWRIAHMSLVPRTGAKLHDLGECLARALEGDWWVRPFVGENEKADTVIGPKVR